MAIRQLGVRATATNEAATLADLDGRIDWTLPSAYLAANLDRNATFSTGLAALSSGRLTMVGIWLRAGMTINSLTFYSGATGAASPTNQWFALYDASRNLLRQTSNDTTTAWGAGAFKTLNLSSSYAVTVTGLYYAGIMVTATTVPSLAGVSGVAGYNGLAPIRSGTSNTGLTTTAPNPANALTALAAIPLALAA